MYDWREEDVAERMKTFQENMEYILSLYRSAGIPVLLGTVPSNLMKPHLTGAYGERYEREVLPLFREGRYEEGYAKAQEILRNAPRHQASAAENEILRGLAQKFDVPLVDVEAAVRAAEPHGIPGERLFGDHCHLNAEGNAVLVREYETALLSLLKSQLGIN
jgi:lysophospholipase L1-like esterase